MTGRSLSAALLLLVLAACGGGEESAPTSAPAPQAAPKTALVRTVAPRPQAVVDKASLPADLMPLRRAVLAAEVPGTVEALPVSEGQRVGAGQTIARIDSRSLQQAVVEQEAVAREAETQAERANSLFAKRSITQQQLLNAVTNRDVARSRLASARLQLDKSRVRAPWAGEVAIKRVEVGDYVQPGQPILELVDARRLKVRAPAPASDVPYLKEGAPVEIAVEALPGETFQGRIVRLGTELDPSARTLTVEAEIANPGGRLKPGMLARMAVPRRTLADALLLPLEAVLDLGGEKAVYTVRDGKARRVPVELGPVVGEEVVVLSGIGAGERVVVEGMQQVSDGQPVEEATAASETPSATATGESQGS